MEVSPKGVQGRSPGRGLRDEVLRYITTMFIQFLTPSDIYRYKVEQHDVSKFQSSGTLEVFKSWGQKISGVCGDRSPPVGSRGKAP